MFNVFDQLYAAKHRQHRGRILPGVLHNSASSIA